MPSVIQNTLQAPPPPALRQQETPLILHNIPWQTYEGLLADLREQSGIWPTYERGTLEITPLTEDVDILHSLFDKLAVFAHFGVREVWRHHNSSASIDRLSGSSYELQERRATFPVLTSARSGEYLNRKMALSESICLADQELD
jgi:hypothetical protein